MAADLQEHADRYERLEIIGRGSFGDVYRGSAVVNTACPCACDHVKLTCCSDCSWDKSLQREVAIKVIDLEDV